jgi:uncharacterized membrane protein
VHQAGVKAYHDIDQEVRFLGLLLCWLQIFDGVLTAIGVSRLGIHFEGNPILRYLMNAHGFEASLFWAKFFCIVAVAFICLFAHRAQWVKSGLSLAIVIYLFVAVVPWVYTLWI